MMTNIFNNKASIERSGKVPTAALYLGSIAAIAGVSALVALSISNNNKSQKKLRS